jgi:muramoyltetrapeptide carboxypeptidase
MPLIPPYLSAGDTILLIATARARSEEAIRPAIALLQSWGLNVEVGPNLYKKHFQFAGTDEERAQDLFWAIQHPTAKAVMLSGGGYGTLRIIDNINFEPIKKQPKWFIGYSDATVIHNRLAALDVACIHGTMAFQLLKNEEAALSVKQLLFGESLHYNFEAHTLNRSGSAEAIVIGGNLSVLYALSGSKDDLNTAGKILFIEDLDEQLYHIDRMMLQMKRAGKLEHLKGLIVGGMTEMKDNMVPYGKCAEEIIWDAIKEYNYPVCFGFPSGHVDRNMALYLNRSATLTVNQNAVHFSI